MTNDLDLQVKPKIEITYDIECTDPVRKDGWLNFMMEFTWRYFTTGANGKGSAMAVYKHKAEIQCRDCIDDLGDFARLIILSLQAVIFETEMLSIYRDQGELLMEDPPGELPNKVPALNLPKTVHEVVAGIYG